MNNNDIHDLLSRVVALLVDIERDYDDSEDPGDLLRAHIDSIVSVRYDAGEMAEALRRANESDCGDR